MPDSLSAIGIAASLAGGVMLGLFHFRLLRSVSLDFARGRAVRAFALQTGRMGLMAAVLVFLARQGAAILLAGALGIMIGRAVIIRRAKRES